MAETVLVGCKAPNGLVLNLDTYERVGDQQTIRRIPGGKTFTLKGWARPINAPDHTEGGYALTPVDADFWAEWLKRNLDSSLLADKIIIPPHKNAIAQARDLAEVPAMHRPARAEDVPGIKPDKAA